MNFFKGMNEAKLVGDRDDIANYPGDHLVALKGFRPGLTERSAVMYVALDLEVIGSKAEGLTKGRDIARAIFRNKVPEYFFTEVRSALAAASGTSATDESIDWEQAADLAKDGSPKFIGKQMLLRVTHTPGKNKKTGEDITNKRVQYFSVG